MFLKPKRREEGKSPDGFRVTEDPMARDGDEEVEVVISNEKESFRTRLFSLHTRLRKRPESFTFLWSWSTNVLNIVCRLRKVMTTKPSSSTGGLERMLLATCFFNVQKRQLNSVFWFKSQNSVPTVFHLVR